MRDKINALLFDFTKDNLHAHEADNILMTSGKNILNEIIQFENGEFSDSPFAQLIEIECESDNYNHIKNETMSNILGIDKNSLFLYEIYTHHFFKKRCFTRGNLPSTLQAKFFILANKGMLEESVPIFEIRFKKYINEEEKWSSWQAISGKFIVTQEYRFGPGGVLGVYSSMTEREIESFKRNFQIRYSGSIITELGMPNTLHRIEDPFNSDIRKIIDPNTFQILFDSQIINEVSSEKSCEVWQKFSDRYS